MRARRLLFIPVKNLYQLFVHAVILMMLSNPAHASPLLRCLVSYAGSTHTIATGLTRQPYDVESIDIGGRFRFKAIMVGAGDNIDYIKLYAYFQTRSNNIPIHQASYLPPFAVSMTPINLTPNNHLYAGDVERELQYQCTLQEVVP